MTFGNKYLDDHIIFCNCPKPEKSELALSDLNVIKKKVRQDNVILFIDTASATKILDSSSGARKYRPHGLFIVIEGGRIASAIDNSDGNAWTEDFWSVESAIKWLVNDNFDYESYLKRHNSRAVKS